MISSINNTANQFQVQSLNGLADAAPSAQTELSMRLLEQGAVSKNQATDYMARLDQINLILPKNEEMCIKAAELLKQAHASGQPVAIPEEIKAYCQERGLPLQSLDGNACTEEQCHYNFNQLIGDRLMLASEMRHLMSVTQNFIAQTSSYVKEATQVMPSR